MLIRLVRNQFPRAFLANNEVRIVELDGSLVTRFPVAENGALSFTNVGIYVGGEGGIRLYAESGSQIWHFKPERQTRGNVYVSQNGKSAVGVENIGTWRVVVYDLVDSVTRYVSEEQGCSGCPSPDGTMMTQNMGSCNTTAGCHAVTGTSCHLFMRIRSTDHSLMKLHQFSLMPVTGYTSADLPPWGWNRQVWSGNSNEWIVIPVGQDRNNSPGCRQLTRNCSPWIYNIVTGSAIRLADRSDDFWQPYDYHWGKRYNQASVARGVTRSPGNGISPIARKILVGSVRSGGLRVTVQGEPGSFETQRVTVRGELISRHWSDAEGVR